MSYSLFSAFTPGVIATNGPDTLGIIFESVLPAQVTGAAYYKPAGATGSVIGVLWSIGGSNLAQVTFSGQTASGWQTMLFPTPYTIVPNTQYVISYTFSGANYGYITPLPTVPSGGNIFGNPLYCPAAYSVYNLGSSVTYPTTVGGAYYYFADVVLDNVSAVSGAQRSRIGEQCVVGALQGISLGGPTSMLGDNTYTRHLQTGVRRENVDGNPAAPCLALDYPGFWRFRWGVKAGANIISVYAKQVSNVTGYRPSMIVKANPSIGVNSDVTSLAPSGTGWVQIPALNVSASAAGVLWVELHNNDTYTFQSTAFFDHIVTQ